METEFDHVMAEALALSPDEREALVVALMDSLGGADEAAAAWHAEIRQRKQALLSGAESAMDWAQARARLQAL